MSTDITTLNINRAAAYLDHFHPGWFYQVDPQTLDMMDGCRCVIGQAFGLSYALGNTWNDKMAELFGDDPSMDPAKSPLGFPPSVFAGPHYKDAWCAAIRQRLVWSDAAAQAHTQPASTNAVDPQVQQQESRLRATAPSSEI